mmetsp:Transcript_89339/g.255869  ORF Transcript_89339/g.255869 Transcript_89339/m.255869 type:complete len:248 (+) Transcript_89339:60-803(+)
MMTSAADPYYVAKEEVEGAIQKVQEMHKEWGRLLQSENTARSQRFQHLHSEISGDLRQLDFDLQDISATISMVEENRKRFQIADTEIASRKAFVTGSRRTLKELQESVGGNAAAAKIEADKRSVLTKKDGGANTERRNQIAKDNDQFLERERQSQQQIIQSQDEALDQIGASAQRLHSAANTISMELKEQQQMLQDLDHDIDKETEKLNFVMKRIGRLMQTSDNKQICLIIGLFVLMIVLVFFIVNS